MDVKKRSDRLIALVKFGIAPSLFFLICFLILTWPAVVRFPTHFFADAGDGLQNIWNIWWVERAVTVLHQNPWRTTYLHYPYGTSLIGHTLTPFNGFFAILLSPFMSLVAVHNCLVTFAFVTAGVTAFLLAHHLTRAYWPSLIAGFMFTFSSFHFEHAEGHLQLVSLQWIPLFVLLWLRLMRKPTIALGVAAALVLFLVILCDYYYFLYCVIAGFIILCWAAIRGEIPRPLKDGRHLVALGTFAAVALATSGVLAGSLLVANQSDPWVGAHLSSDYALDLLAPFIYGGHWRFASLTSRYWTRLQANYHESSVHLGFSMLLPIVYLGWKRQDTRVGEVGLFFLLFVLFFMAALGPILLVGGKDVFGGRRILPYALLEILFPPLNVSGVPIRMMVMVVLSGAVLSAFAFARLLRGSTREKTFALCMTSLLVIEYLPKPIATVQMPIPHYVMVLKNLPGNEGILDTVGGDDVGMFYQTIHGKPLALGYLARVPQSVDAKDRQLEDLIRSERFDRLWPDYRLRYVVGADTNHALRTWTGTRTIWDDGRIGVFDVSALEPRSAQAR